MSYGFCSKFHILSSSAKILKIGKDLTKLQRVSRWELFLRHSVEQVTRLRQSAAHAPIQYGDFNRMGHLEAKFYVEWLGFAPISMDR